MNSLIWQSVMWRPGTGRFLIGMKNPLPTRPARPPDNAPLPGARRSPEFATSVGYALPPSRIRRHFSSRLTLPRNPDCRAAAGDVRTEQDAALAPKRWHRCSARQALPLPAMAHSRPALDPSRDREETFAFA